MGRKRKAVEGDTDNNTTVKEDETFNANPGTTSSTNEISHLHTDNPNPMTVDENVQPNINDSPKKKNKVTQVFARRSTRLKNSVLPSDQSQGVAEHVNLVDIEKEKEEVPQSQQVIGTSMPVLMEKKKSEEEPNDQVEPVVERNLDEKIDHVVPSVDAIKSKITRTPNEGFCPELTYKSLYIDALKKIEAFMEENYKLRSKLDFANGKIEAYEKHFVGALKEVILVSGLGKKTDGTMNSSPQKDEKCSPISGVDPTDANGGDSKPRKNKYKKKKSNL